MQDQDSAKRCDDHVQLGEDKGNRNPNHPSREDVGKCRNPP